MECHHSVELLQRLCDAQCVGDVLDVVGAHVAGQPVGGCKHGDVAVAMLMLGEARTAAAARACL